MDMFQDIYCTMMLVGVWWRTLKGWAVSSECVVLFGGARVSFVCGILRGGTSDLVYVICQWNILFMPFIIPLRNIVLCSSSLWQLERADEWWVDLFSVSDSLPIDTCFFEWKRGYRVANAPSFLSILVSVHFYVCSTLLRTYVSQEKKRTEKLGM